MDITSIMKEVHQQPDFTRYESTNVRNNTNCYSHAIGTSRLVRIGQISSKKDIEEKYVSVEEIVELLVEDFNVLGLQLEESSEEEQIGENQHKIALFIKKWPNGAIADYHFWRCDNNVWSEKWRGRVMNKEIDFERDSKDTYLRTLVGIYKVTR